MIFSIDYDDQPKKFLKKQDKQLSKRIIDKLEFILSSNPVPPNARRITNHKELVFRIRIGNYRVLYRINYKTNRIIIIKIDKRSKAYQQI